MKKIALICGITGQDGAYLANFLLKKDYEVWGTSRDSFNSNLSNLHKLGICEKVRLLSMDVKDFRSVYSVITKVNPDEIYYLAGQSSVGLSFELPSETIESIALGVLNLLEICRISQKPIKLYNAGSSECFGNAPVPAHEKTPFEPKSPYAVAKCSAFWLVNNYRESYNIHACTGILFNHESPLRPQRFVTQKIISTVKAIADGRQDKLILGQLDIVRDWGFAPEYVEAMWLMLQSDTPQDFVVATGKSYSLEYFVASAFAYFDLTWQNYVEISTEYYRPSEIAMSKADPSLIYQKLGWQANLTLDKIIEKMIKNELY